MDLVSRAREVATAAHRGQVDKSGAPYTEDHGPGSRSGGCPHCGYVVTQECESFVVRAGDARFVAERSGRLARPGETGGAPTPVANERCRAR